MKVYCCFTPAHEVLFERYFLPTLPSTFSVASTRFKIQGAGDFLSREFIDCIWQKIDLVLESVTQNAGKIIVWSDIDIQFFDLSPEMLLSELGINDIAFQREGYNTPDVNTGFFVCRCNDRITAFFKSVRDALKRNPSTNEQYIINELIKANTAELT